MMNIKKAFCLLLSMALILTISMPGAYAAEIAEVGLSEYAHGIGTSAADEKESPAEVTPESDSPGSLAADHPAILLDEDTAADDHDCTCGEDAPDNLAYHSDTCPRKQYVLSLIRSESGSYRTASQIYAAWGSYDAATRTDILNMVAAYVPTEYGALVALIESGSTDEPGITVDGVTVTGIPAGVTATVTNVAPREISREALKKIGRHKLTFSMDITLQTDAGVWQPGEGEMVTVSLDAAQFGLENGEKIEILHEHNGILQDVGAFTVSSGKLTFETDGFSNFYGYTVDFEYDGTWYSIGGGSDVYLYELFPMLGIHRSAADVVDVSVSDPSLLLPEKVPVNDYTEETTWMLHSIRAFDTAETMTLSFRDGSSLTLSVYDANYSALPSGDYVFQDGDTIGAVSIPNYSVVNITLNGTVTVNGTISVGLGVTLTITGSGTFKRGSSFKDKMFYVASGGNLIIKGDSGNNIIIDGNAGFTSTDVPNSTRKLLKTSGTEATSAIIYVGYAGTDTIAATVGNVTIENVTMQNLYSTDQSPAIYVTGSTKDSIHSTVTMKNVIVQKCATTSSDALILVNDCIATLEHCSILDNYSGGLYSGAVKAGGQTWFSQLTMTNCTANRNYSSGWGGAVLWAANNTCNGMSSRAIIDNCTFTENTARWLGGALSNEAIMEVKNTTIKNNIAMAGGGIATFPFTLTESTAEGGNACGLTLGSGNIISNNTAYAAGDFTPYSKQDSSGTDANGDDEDPIDDQITYTGGGGGVWCYMNKDHWTCGMEIGEGNVISDNHSNNVGGGVYIDKVSGSTTTLSITGATVSGNEAVHGGGIAVKAADVTVSAGNIESNVASKNGGGVYVQSGSATVTGIGSVSSNIATNGGGLYINTGEILVSGGIVANNKAVGTYDGQTTRVDPAGLQGVGGGVFLKDGKLTLNGANIGIYSNEAQVAANDVYASGNNTTVIVPDVSHMDLTGMTGEVKPIGWFADYKADDTNYPQSVVGYANPGRYVESSEGNIELLHASIDANRGTFYCLTLGIPYPGYGTLTITKEGIDSRDHDGNGEIQSSIFQVMGKTARGAEISFTVAVVGNGSVTIRHLPDGEYTVTELTDWTWRYDLQSKTYHPTGSSGSEKTIVISALHHEWNADFVNRRKQQYWLSGDSYCENCWGDQTENRSARKKETE